MLTGDGLYNEFKNKITKDFPDAAKSLTVPETESYLKALFSSIIDYIKANAEVNTNVNTNVTGSLGSGTGVGTGKGKIT